MAPAHSALPPVILPVEGLLESLITSVPAFSIAKPFATGVNSSLRPLSIVNPFKSIVISLPSGMMIAEPNVNIWRYWNSSGLYGNGCLGVSDSAIVTIGIINIVFIDIYEVEISFPL